MLRPIIACLLCAAAVAAVAQDAVNETLFRYTGPTGYTRDDARSQRAQITFWADPKGGFTSNLGILFGPTARKSSREMGQGKANLWAGKSGVKILSQGAASLGGRDAYFIETSHVRGNLKLFIYSVTCVTKGQVVDIDINGLLSDKPTIVKKFKASLKSFKWLD